MSTYKVGLIGCGWVAGEHIAAFQNNPHTEVVALSSRTKEGAQAKANECGIDAQCYDSPEAMLAAEKLDIVSVTSPPQFHVDHAVLAAKHGAQLVMEKPIAMNKEDLTRLVDCVKEQQTKSVVSFVLRWNPLYDIIRSILNNNQCGDLYYGEVDYYHGIGPWYKQFEWNVTKTAGGSSLLSAGCHAVDGLVWFMGSKVVEVHSYAVRGKAPEYQPYEYEPTIVSILKFENGTIGKVTSSIECKSPYMFNINLFGSRGTVRNNQLYSDDLKGQTHFATIPTIMPDSGDVTHHPFQGEVDHFVECLQSGKDSDVNIEYAAHIMEICYAAVESAETGQSVKIG